MKCNLKNNKLVKETVWSLLAKAAAFIFYFGLNIFLARYLGPESFGAWSFYYSILNIFLLLSYLGINGSARTFIAKLNNTDDLGAVLKSSIKIRFYSSLSFTLIFLLTHRLIAVMLQRPDFETLLLISAPLFIFAGLVEFFKHAFEGLHRLKYVFIITVSEHVMKFFITLMFLLLINGLIALVLSYNLAFIITFFIGASYYYKFYKKNTVSSTQYDKDILRYSIPLFIINIGFLIAVELDVFMIGLFKLDSEVGIYAVAKQIIVKIPHLVLAISMGTMPVFAKINDTNKIELSKLFMKLLKTNTSFIGAVCIIIIGSGWFFVPVIYGNDYKASVLPLMILTIYLMLFSYSIFLSTFLDYQGKAQKRALNLSFTIVLNVLLNYILIPRFGANGAAIGTSLSFIPYVYLNWLEVRKHIKI